MSPSSHNNQSVSEAEFVAVYGEHPVSLEGLPRPITINFALAMEASSCPATAEKRADESARLRRLAGYVGAALLPEHQHLLAET